MKKGGNGGEKGREGRLTVRQRLVVAELSAGVVPHPERSLSTAASASHTIQSIGNMRTYRVYVRASKISNGAHAMITIISSADGHRNVVAVARLPVEIYGPVCLAVGQVVGRGAWESEGAIIDCWDADALKSSVVVD